MKKVYKNILGVILFLLIILLVGGVISDLVDLILNNKVNGILIFLIKWILIFLLITILLNTHTGKNLQKSIFGK